LATRTSAREQAPAVVARDDYDASPIRRAIVVLVALKIAGIILIFDPSGLDVFHLAKSLFSRGLAWLLAALVVVALMRFGPAVVPRTRLHLFVLAFAVANVLSMLSAENAYVAMFGEREKYLGLTFLVDMLVLYIAVAISFRRPADWAVLAIAIALAGALAIGYAAAQSLGLDPVRWDAAAQPSGTFGNPDMLGHFLSLFFGGALGIAVLATGRGALVLRVAATSVAAIALVVATTIATRGSLLGFVGALTVAALVQLRVRGVSRSTVGRIALRGLAALVLLAAIVALSPLAQRVRTTVQGEQVRDRTLVYKSAVIALADRPLFGYGPDNFAVAYPRYRQADSIVRLGMGPETSAHSWPFQAAATLGVVGLVALLALMFVAVRSLWRRGLARSPAVAVPVLLASAAYWTHGLVAVDTISLDWWPWVTFGAAAALGANTVSATRSFNPPRLVAAWCVVGVALIASLFGITALRSNESALTAKLAWEDGRVANALDAAAASVKQDPGRADHWNWLGLALDLQGQWRAAGDAFLEATARAPHEAVYWSNLARSRAREAISGQEGSGDGTTALDAARRAVATDPNAPEANAVLAEIANVFGEYELALDAASHAIRLYPDEPSYDFIAAEAALGIADPTTAQRKLEELIVIHDSATLRVTAAQLALALDDREGARKNARRALDLEPRNSTAIAILKDAGG
jgi:O-antigen ligase/Flp pilus assembly protein TadD